MPNPEQPERPDHDPFNDFNVARLHEAQRDLADQELMRVPPGTDFPTFPEMPPPPTRTAENLQTRRRVLDTLMPAERPPQAARARAPRPEPEPIITGVRLVETTPYADKFLVEAEFTHHNGLTQTLAFDYYSDVNRTLRPYNRALMARLVVYIQAAAGLPTPPRQEIQNPTIGERLFNMVHLLIDKSEPSDTLAAEWEALRAEYERAAGARR